MAVTSFQRDGITIYEFGREDIDRLTALISRRGSMSKEQFSKELKQLKKKKLPS